MKYSKLHTFGDSFTMGSGLRGDAVEPFYPYQAKYTDHIWATILGKKLNLEVNNTGVGGVSNEDILFSLNCGMQFLGKNPLIIVGLTAPTRLSMKFNKPNDHWGGLTLVPHLYEKYMESGSDFLGEFRNFFTKEELDSFVAYYGALFPKHSNANWNYYAYLCIQLQNYFTNIGTRFIIWDYTLWTEFETIYQWSGGELDDLHWSPNGNHDFANFMEYCIKIEAPYASFDELVLWRKGEGRDITQELYEYY